MTFAPAAWDTLGHGGGPFGRWPYLARPTRPLPETGPARRRGAPPRGNAPHLGTGRASALERRRPVGHPNRPTGDRTRRISARRSARWAASHTMPAGGALRAGSSPAALPPRIAAPLPDPKGPERRLSRPDSPEMGLCPAMRHSKSIRSTLVRPRRPPACSLSKWRHEARPGSDAPGAVGGRGTGSKVESHPLGGAFQHE